MIKEKGGMISIGRQIYIFAGALVLIGVLLAHFINYSFIWLAGIIGAGLVFSGVSGLCMMEMVFAKMPWNNR